MATERTPPTPAMIRAVEAAANLPAFSVPAVDPASLVPPVVPGTPTEEPGVSPAGERGPAGVPGATGQPGTTGLAGLPGPALTPLLGMIRETVERASSAGIASLVAGSPLTGVPVVPTAQPQGQPGEAGPAGAPGSAGVSGAIQQAVETTLTALASAQPVASAVSVPPGPGIPPASTTQATPSSAPVLTQHLTAAREAVAQAAPGAAPAVSPAIPPGFSASVPPPLAPLLPPTQAAPAVPLPVGSRLPDGSAAPPPLSPLLAPGAVAALQAASPGGQATPGAAAAGVSQTMSAGPGVLQARLAAALAAASPGGPSGSVTGQAAAASPNLGSVLTGAPVATAGAGQGREQAHESSAAPASGAQVGYLASMDAHLARIAEALQRSTPAREQAREQREPAEGKGQDVSLQGILGSALQGALAGLGNVSPHFRAAASGIGGAVESASDAVSPFFPKKQPEADEPSREPSGGGIDLKGIGRVLERAGPTESAGVAPRAATAVEGATTAATGEAAVASGAGAASAAAGGGTAAGMAAGGEAAIGGEAVAAGAAGGPIGLIVAAVVAAVAKVVQAFVELPGKMLAFGESVLDSSKHLADYNATISVALAHAEVADIHRDIRLGAETEGSTAVLAEALTDLKDAMLPQTAALANFSNGLASLGARVGELLASITGPLFDVLGTIGKLMSVLAKIMGEIVDWMTKEFSRFFKNFLELNPALVQLLGGVRDLDKTLDEMLGLKANQNTLFGAALGNIANRPMGSPLRSLRIPPVIP